MRIGRRSITTVGVVAAAAAVAGGVAQGVSGEEPTPKAPIPRVCWFSDYANAKLSNKCEYRSGERRWYMQVGGRMVPADRQRLPVANLCLYFHGQKCPNRRPATRRSPDQPKTAAAASKQ
jgi:hypothetical protein